MTRQPIVFGTPQEAAGPSGRVSEGDRDKHRLRAERFKVDYHEPTTSNAAILDGGLNGRNAAVQHQNGRQRARKGQPGFTTGMDLYSEEELARRKDRAGRFQTHDTTLEYRPPTPPEDEAKKRERAARFGTDYTAADDTGLMDVDLLEERKEAVPDIARCCEAVHLYGVDLMSTADCLAYFEDWGPTHVEWINDSSCNVVFADGYTAKRAIAGRGRPLAPEDSPDCAGLDPTDVGNMAFLWHKGADFSKGGVAIPLLYRMATVADVKPPPGQTFSRYLWKGASSQGHGGKRQNAGNGKRGAGAPMESEDVAMRPERGGRKKQRRLRRQQVLEDTEMEDAEKEEGGTEELADADAADASDVVQPDVTDLRELLKRKDESQTRLFSAAAAGIVPDFLKDDVAGEVPVSGVSAEVPHGTAGHA